MVEFNYAKLDFSSSITLDAGDTIQYINGKKFLCWHDLIDIRVPLETMPEILLSPRIIKPLYGVNPRSILTKIDKNWWDRTRKKAYASSNDTCRCCGMHKSLQKYYPKNIDAHELYNIDYRTGKVELDYIVPLCSSMCHKAVHYGRLTAQFESGKLQDKVYYGIISHANSILAQNNLPSKNWDITVNDNIANIPWDKWHLDLTINGEKREFYSLFKDEAELDASY